MNSTRTLLLLALLALTPSLAHASKFPGGEVILFFVYLFLGALIVGLSVPLVVNIFALGFVKGTVYTAGALFVVAACALVANVASSRALNSIFAKELSSARAIAIEESQKRRDEAAAKRSGTAGASGEAGTAGASDPTAAGQTNTGSDTSAAAAAKGTTNLNLAIVRLEPYFYFSGKVPFIVTSLLAFGLLILLRSFGLFAGMQIWQIMITVIFATFPICYVIKSKFFPNELF